MEVSSALRVLKDRRLPSLDADLLVAAIYNSLKPAFEQHEEIVKKLRQQLEEAKTDGLKDDAPEVREILKQFDGLNTHQFEVAAPRQKLTKDHLPKAYTGGKDGAGEANGTGLAGIIIALGDEYFADPTLTPE